MDNARDELGWSYRRNVAREIRQTFTGEEDVEVRDVELPEDITGVCFVCGFLARFLLHMVLARLWRLRDVFGSPAHPLFLRVQFPSLIFRRLSRSVCLYFGFFRQRQ